MRADHFETCIRHFSGCSRIRGSHNLAGTSGTSFKSSDAVSTNGTSSIRRYIVRIFTHNVPERSVTLQGQIFFALSTLKTALGGIDDSLHVTAMPISNGIAETVINFLAVVIRRHNLQ